MNSKDPISGLTPDETVNQIIEAYPRAESLLNSIGLRPDDHKHDTLRSVCFQLQWDEEEVLRWIKKNRRDEIDTKHETDQENIADYGTDLSRWCRYIAENYHEHLFGLLDEVERDFPVISKIHGNQYPLLKQVKAPLQTFDEKLRLYLRFEQNKMFPLLEKLMKERELRDGTLQNITGGLDIMKEDQRILLKEMTIIKRINYEMRHPEGAFARLRIFNSTLDNLFQKVRNQFEIEREQLMPIVKDRIR